MTLAAPHGVSVERATALLAHPRETVAGRGVTRRDTARGSDQYLINRGIR